MLNKTQKKALLKSILTAMKRNPDLQFDDVIRLCEDSVLFLKEVRFTVLMHMTIPEPEEHR